MTEQLLKKIKKVEFLKEVSLKTKDLDWILAVYQKNKAFEINNSVVIEGSTITLLDTEKLLKHEVLSNEYSTREIAEVNGLNRAYDLAISLLGVRLQKVMLEDWHERLAFMYKFAGEFRLVNVTSSSHRHEAKPIYPDHFEIQTLMDDMIESYNCESYSKLEKVCNLKVDFVLIHPFEDGNGRLSRLLLNWSLMSFGYLPVTIRSDEKTRYIQILEGCRTTSNYDAFTEFICDKLIELYTAEMPEEV